MPLLWRYLLIHYLRVFFLCVASFIAILLTLRLGEIAYFATLGPEALSIVWFVLQQIPYVLPIAFPVSALISSVLLVQELSESRELTAIRSCGFSLSDLLAPVLTAALFLSLVNFYIVSEVSTASHLTSAQLKYQLRSMNPLLLLNNKTLMQMKGLYFDTLGPSRVGEFAEDILFLYPGAHTDRFSLIVAKRIDVMQQKFFGTSITLITAQPSSTPCDQDQLIVENIQSTHIALDDFAKLLEKKIWSLNNDHLPLAQLLVRQEEARAKRERAQTPAELKEAKHEYYRTITEMERRFSVALAVFTFTLMGLSFGITIGRARTHRGLLCVVFFGALYLIAFFIGKSFDQALAIATICYLAPHLLMCVASVWMLRRISRGVE